MYQIRIRRSVELAHRLSHPDAPQKCQSVHGHSWRIDVHVGARTLDARDMLVEFGAFKRKWFNYLDSNVCHHLALASGDHYTQIIQKADPDARLLVLAGQPTTEHLARFLFTKAKKILSTLRKDASVLQVDLRETERNMASYSESA